MGSSTIPMQAAQYDLSTWLETSTKVEKDGEVKLSFTVGTTSEYEALNNLETTDVVYLRNLPGSYELRKEMYKKLLDRLDSENGKHYIVIDPRYSKELIAFINERRIELDEKTKEPKERYAVRKPIETNIVFARRPKELKHSSADEAAIYALKQAETKEEFASCEAVAVMQKGALTTLRPSLQDEKVWDKNKKRYSPEAIVAKAQSGKITNYGEWKGDKPVKTLLANAHSMADKTLLDKVVYVSDIMPDKELIEAANARAKSDSSQTLEEIVFDFMQRALNQLWIDHPDAELITLMGPGDINDPLVKCINYAKSRGMFTLLSEDQQIEHGLIIYFQEKAPAPKESKAGKHSPAKFFHPKKHPIITVRHDGSEHVVEPPSP